MDNKLTVSQQRTRVGKKANGILASRWREVKFPSTELPSTMETWISWTKPIKGYWNDEGIGALLLWGKAEGTGPVQPWEEKAQEDRINVSKYLKGRMPRGWGPTLLSDAQQQNKRQLVQTGTQEVLSEHEEKLYCESYWALVQVAQGGYVVSFKYSKAAWTESWVMCSECPCLSREVVLDGCQRSFPASTILYFCDL